MDETRRDWLAKVTMGVGLVLGYGVFAAQGLSLFIAQTVEAKNEAVVCGTGRAIPRGAGGIDL